ncbi:MAG: tetratricopeptide repeat protein [Empedobacter falsenii]
MKKLFTLFVLFLGLGMANAQTQDNGQKEVDAGLEAAKNKNYALAMDQFKIASEKGNSNGDYYIGHLYDNGLGVEKNTKQSIKWYQQAAAKNNTGAMNDLGIVFLNSEQYKDVQTAIKWFKQAAAKNNTGAMNDLGIVFLNSEQYKDVQTAIKWFKQAAEQDNNGAMYNLGVTYYYDDYGVRNITESYNWYRKAADKKHHDAIINLNILYFANEFSTPPTEEEFLHYFKDHIISENLIGLISGDEIKILSADECQIKLHLTSVLNGSLYELVLPTKINEISSGGFITYEKEIASKKLISMVDEQWIADDKKDLNKVIKLKRIDQVRLDIEEFNAAYYEKIFRFASSLCKK